MNLHTDLPNYQLSLVPLGAGDLIDRAVRFYRKNFWTFLLIAAPPVVVGTLFLVGWTTLGRSLFSAGSTSEVELSLYQMFVGLGGLIIWMIQMIATLVVMGGASRNFVRHLLYGEPITFRETYKNAVGRFWGLTAISTLVAVILGFFGVIVFYIGLLVGSIGVFVAVYAFTSIPIVGFIVSLAIGIGTTFGTLWLLFLGISRFVYVPQVMLVEGQDGISAIGRSFSLASKNVKRVAMLFIFTLVATYSALAILYVPLGWYAWVEGVQIFSFTATDAIPAWYEISSQVISQASLILLTPIWMIGLCLLYIDERVRKEGYDIELLAARRLGDIPSVPQKYVNPLQPALSKAAKPAKSEPAVARSKCKNNSTLGLD